MKVLISFIFIWLITPNVVFAHCGKCGIGDKKDHHEKCSYVKDGKKVNCSAKDHVNCPLCKTKDHANCPLCKAGDHVNCPLCKAGDHANCSYCNKKNESTTQKKSSTKNTNPAAAQNTPTTKNTAPTKK